MNYQIPNGTATGQATVTITIEFGDISIENIQVTTINPGLFSATSDGVGYAAANVQRVRGAVSTFEDVARYDSA